MTLHCHSVSLPRKCKQTTGWELLIGLDQRQKTKHFKFLLDAFLIPHSGGFVSSRSGWIKQRRVKSQQLFEHRHSDLCVQGDSKPTGFMMHCFSSQVLSWNESVTVWKRSFLRLDGCHRRIEHQQRSPRWIVICWHTSERNSLVRFLIALRNEINSSFLTTPAYCRLYFRFLLLCNNFCLLSDIWPWLNPLLCVSASKQVKDFQS